MDHCSNARVRTIAAAILVALTATVGASPALAGKGPGFRYTYVGHIGSRGSAPGQFAGTSTAGPGGIAVDQGCGDVYIGDLGRGVVYRYDENGKFLNQIGTPGNGVGQIVEPAGIFIDSPVMPLNLDGPPQHCAGFGGMGPLVWIADYGAHRIPVFTETGEFKGAWCNPVGSGEGCDVTRGGHEGFDYDPHDVWVNGDSVYIAGRVSNTIAQYNRSGDYIRSSDETHGAAFSIAAQGTQLWSTYGNSQIASFDLNPTKSTMTLVHLYGAGFNSSAPGQFADPRALWIGYDGKLYVLDETRVQVFSPSGIYLSAIKLPKSVAGVDVATRYDGTVYVSNAIGYGADVWSPGPIVSLRKAPGARNEIVLVGRVNPPHRGDAIVLQFIAANGWRNIVKLRLDRHSRFKFTWHPPQRNAHYQVRAWFKDPHRYHADRASAIMDVASR